MYHCCYFHLLGEPPSSIGNLEVVREVCKFYVTWEEPIVSNGDIMGYTVEITLLASTGEHKIENDTNVSGTSRTALYAYSLC